MSFMVDSWEALSTSTGFHEVLVNFLVNFHEGHQDSAVLISVVTQRGILVVGIVYGCPYFKDPATFSLVSKVPQVKKSFIPY